MADPTRKSTIHPDSPPQWSVALTVKVDGTASVVLSLPPHLTTEEEANVWLIELGNKMEDDSTPPTAFDDNERSFIRSLTYAAHKLVESGFEWKVQGLVTPEGTKALAAAAFATQPTDGKVH